MGKTDKRTAEEHRTKYKEYYQRVIKPVREAARPLCSAPGCTSKTIYIRGKFCKEHRDLQALKVVADTTSWYHKNREKVTDRRLQRAYGITLKQAREMLASQGGVCAICKNLLEDQACAGKSRRGTVIDHCHETGLVRGVLCSLCNKGLGHFSDNPEFLGAAISYLAGATQNPCLGDGAR
ncbi:MAG: Pectobacterium phage [Pseudomonadota bacterium]|jgi:hypothetical protein